MEKVNGDTNRAEGAGLPREELGPFLLLGVNKEAGADRVDARWAERVREARQGRIGVPVQDLHWAHDVLCDTDRRVNADVTSWNLDTAAGTLRSLEEAYGLTATGP